MKLYTEEEIRKVLAPILLNPPKSSSSYDLFFDSLTPIELPSDEEIAKGLRNEEMHSYAAFEGAIWLKEQILNQNK